MEATSSATHSVKDLTKLAILLDYTHRWLFLIRKVGLVLLNEWVVEGVDSDPHEINLYKREREIKNDSRMNHDKTYVMIQGVLCANVPID